MNPGYAKRFVVYVVVVFVFFQTNDNNDKDVDGGMTMKMGRWMECGVGWFVFC